MSRMVNEGCVLYTPFSAESTYVDCTVGALARVAANYCVPVSACTVINTVYVVCSSVCIQASGGAGDAASTMGLSLGFS